MVPVSNNSQPLTAATFTRHAVTNQPIDAFLNALERTRIARVPGRGQRGLECHVLTQARSRRRTAAGWLGEPAGCNQWAVVCGTLSCATNKQTSISSSGSAARNPAKWSEHDLRTRLERRSKRSQRDDDTERFQMGKRVRRCRSFRALSSRWPSIPAFPPCRPELVAGQHKSPRRT